MFAVVETGGKQYQVEEGRYIDIDLLHAEENASYTLDKVVAIIAGEYTQVGQPLVEGAAVQVKILKHGKGKKTISFKMKRKKGYRLKKGHRQDYTRIMVENIEFPNKQETLNYVKQLDEKLMQEIQEKETKFQEAKEKRVVKKQTRKETLKNAAKVKAAKRAETKDAVKPEKAPKPEVEVVETAALAPEVNEVPVENNVESTVENTEN
jgi:large subunit ribosomal protein L21